MANKQAFQHAKKEHLKTLKQYVPVVARVHGANHPEFHEVHKWFDRLVENVENKGTDTQDLNDVFEALRTTTNHYTVPEDVCESFEAVYRMLSALDEAYYKD